MSAPERIVMCPDDCEREWFQCDYQPHMGPWVGYLRADLHDATLTALRAQVETLREALEFYADKSAWNQPPVKTSEGLLGIEYENQASLMQRDRGAKARAALSAVSRDDTSEVSDG